MNYIITGSSGFIGQNLIESLDSTKIMGIDMCPGKYTCAAIDISKDNLPIKGQGDTFIHLAANTGVLPSIKSPQVDFEYNCRGILNCLEACRKYGIKNFVFASSGSVLGEIDPPSREDKKGSPMSPYGASKAAGEAYCAAYYHSYGINTVCLRFSNVYGPYSYNKNSFIAKFIKHVLFHNKEPFFIYGDGEQTRDFVHVKDLCEGIKLSAESGLGGETFQLGSGKNTSINEVVDILKYYLKNKTGLECDVINGEAQQGEIKYNYPDITKARELLKYDPKVDLDTGIKETIDWFIKNIKRN